LKEWQSAAQNIVALRQLQSLIALLIQQHTMLIHHQEALNQPPHGKRIRERKKGVE
jgi:hypothetical protein